MRLLRLFKIYSVIYRYGLDKLILEAEPSGRLLKAWKLVFGWRHLPDTRSVRLRKALEELGPIFVKFGQMLSTRRDLIPSDICVELTKLQDRVPPFPSDQARQIVESHFQASVTKVFAEFDADPTASASVAQVHFGKLHSGQEVAIKILRPGIERVIANDIALLKMTAAILEKIWPEGRRLKPREVVDEFAKYTTDELDLMHEAANCAQLRRNFQGSALLYVPEVHWDYCSKRIMVMERIYGTSISQIDELRSKGIDVPELSRKGVEIFFTQVFRHGFFHADMHPGNIFVAEDGRYIAVDFGIIGTLNDSDKQYLAQNFIAFFKRDYKRVAKAHLEAGWVPAHTRVEEFEGAIRTVCEPIFDRPLKDISFGKTLLRLFQTARRFEMEVQPQLVLLQKTLLHVEGLGRQLDPELDLWNTAKPFLERWMSEQLGWRAIATHLREESPHWINALPQLPRLVHRALDQHDKAGNTNQLLSELSRQQRRQSYILVGVIFLLTFIIVFNIWQFINP